MMRREFIALVGGAVLIWPLAASAQSPDDRVRIFQDRILRMQAEAIAEKVDYFIKKVEGHGRKGSPGPAMLGCDAA